MKTIHLTLTGLNITDVLSTLQKDALTPTYLGTDQHLNLLFQLTYPEEKESIIQSLLELIGCYEILDQELDVIVKDVFLKLDLSPETKAKILKTIKATFSQLGKKVIKKLEYENG
jgi:hypothetical protein